MTEKASLSIGEAVAYLREHYELDIKPRRLRRWLDRELIPRALQTPGGHWEIPKSSIDDFISRFRTKDHQTSSS